MILVLLSFNRGRTMALVPLGDFGIMFQIVWNLCSGRRQSQRWQ